MRFNKRFALLAFSFLMFFGMVAFSAPETSAQRSVSRVIYRPVYYRRPFITRRYYDPFYDPYLRAKRDRYYAEQRVARERRDMAEHREKYSADGYIDAKERRQMISDQEQLAKAVRDLRQYTSRY